MVVVRGKLCDDDDDDECVHTPRVNIQKIQHLGDSLPPHPVSVHRFLILGEQSHLPNNGN